MIMKTECFIVRLKLGYAVLACCLFACGLCAEVLTWRSTNGQSVEAEFVKLSGQMVTLKRADGVTVNVRLLALDADSQSQARRLASDARSAGGDATTGDGAKENKPTLGSLAKAKASGIPSDEEIKNFLTTYKESPTSAETYEFSARFSVPALKPDDIKSFTRKKKIPFRLTVELERVKMVDGKRRSVLVNGDARFVVLSEAGDVIDRQREALGKLCPS